MAHGFEPILASDGPALELLTQEFPQLECLELPGYGITYSKRGQFLKLKLLQNSPKVINAVKAEKSATKRIVSTHGIEGIISDNRLGVRHELVPSVFVTHQLQLLSGNTTWLSTKLQQKFIGKFDVCWVPDVAGTPNISGKLGHPKQPNPKVKYIGPLSRFEPLNLEKKYDVTVLLSGPEPQRTLLETKLLSEFGNFEGKVLFIKGTVEKKHTVSEHNTMVIHNFLMGSALEKALNESHLVLSRSGYTTIMDLAKLGKKAFFIPTPGQFEQEYLAKRLDESGLVPHCKQDDFGLHQLQRCIGYDGLATLDGHPDFGNLFGLFERE